MNENPDEKGVTFTEEEITEVEKVLIEGTDENLIPDWQSEEIDPDQMIKALEKMRDELEETETELINQKIEAESAALEVYIDSMFHMNEVRDLLHENSSNLFSPEFLNKTDTLLFKMRNLISKERNKFNKSLVKQNISKKDRESMMKMFFQQTKPLRDDIMKFSQLIMELKRTRKVIKESIRNKKA